MMRNISSVLWEDKQPTCTRPAIKIQKENRAAVADDRARCDTPKKAMHSTNPSPGCIENYIWEKDIGKCVSLYSIQMN